MYKAEKEGSERVWKRRAGSVTTVNQRVKTTEGASNHRPELLSTGPHLITTVANLEEKLV